MGRIRRVVDFVAVYVCKSLQTHQHWELFQNSKRKHIRLYLDTHGLELESIPEWYFAIARWTYVVGNRTTGRHLCYQPTLNCNWSNFRSCDTCWMAGRERKNLADLRAESDTSFHVASLACGPSVSLPFPRPSVLLFRGLVFVFFNTCLSAHFGSLT